MWVLNESKRMVWSDEEYEMRRDCCHHGMTAVQKFRKDEAYHVQHTSDFDVRRCSSITSARARRLSDRQARYDDDDQNVHRC